MRVLDESGKSVSAGTTLALKDLGLPVRGTDAVLIVFWKGL
jgi:hypothetical protein